MCPQRPLLSWGGGGVGRGVDSQTLNSSPKWFNLPDPGTQTYPIVPVSDGLQGPRHPQLESSSPSSFNQSDGGSPCARKISTEGKNPLCSPPLPHPLLPVPGNRGGCQAPETPLGPPVTDWESGNECSGKVPPPRVRPHQSACWQAPLPFNIVKPPTERGLPPARPN